MTVAERLIFQDGVKFILTDNSGVTEAIYPTTEANKTIVVGGPLDTVVLSPNNHYTFSSFMGWEWYAVIPGFLHQSYPNIKTIFTASTDDLSGHAGVANFEKGIAAYGFQLVEAMYYPATATDMSSIALKAVSDNPDGVNCGGGGPALDALLIKALWQAGYKGQMFAISAEPLGTVGKIAPAAALEGLIASAWPVEFDPASTPIAAAFKQAFAAKFGSWTSPTITGALPYTVLTTALQQAGSLDTDQVAAVISNGLKFEGPNGPGEMAPRPDLGNTRTVDAVVGIPIKTIKSDTATLLNTLTVDQAVGYYTSVFK
jgi:ABC-type branched-subunit amino acid transport system substrate-binding protein